MYIVGFFGNGEVSQAHRHGALESPDKQRQRRYGRDNLNSAERQEHTVGDNLETFWIEEHLQSGELRVDAEGHRRAVSLLQLVGGVDLYLKFDGFDRRSFDAHRLGAVTALTACCLCLQSTREGFGVILKHNH